MSGFLNKLAGALFFVIGLVAAGGAGLALIETRAFEAEKAEALAGQPPGAVAVEDFSRAAHAGPAGEVVLRGVAPPAQVFQQPSEHTRWIAPLLAMDAEEPNAAPAAWLVGARPWTAETLGRYVTGRTEVGFVLEANGLLVDPKLHFGAIQKVAGAFDAGALVVQPFEGSRADALAPAEGSDMLNLGVLALGFAVVGYGAHLFAKRPRGA